MFTPSLHSDIYLPAQDKSSQCVLLPTSCFHIQCQVQADQSPHHTHHTRMSGIILFLSSPPPVSTLDPGDCLQLVLHRPSSNTMTSGWGLITKDSHSSRLSSLVLKAIKVDWSSVKNRCFNWTSMSWGWLHGTSLLLQISSTLFKFSSYLLHMRNHLIKSDKPLHRRPQQPNWGIKT